MSLTWISVKPKLQEGIQIINSLNIKEFSKLLQRILKQTEFTSSELSGLQAALEIQPSHIELLLQTIVYIFKQSSKVILKPTTLQKQLIEDLKFDNDKAEAFVKVWTIQTKQDFENIEDRLKLSIMSWELNLETSSFTKPKKVIPNVRLKLSLNNSNNEFSKNVVFEMDKTELEQLYNTLETIQNKLDVFQKSTE
ncbi:hypothetical protein FQR65_LT05543 [Abscondita terminalis]|nr:hypothetical protein FQR65_LT05543 [Abscondita terminalis]